MTDKPSKDAAPGQPQPSEADRMQDLPKQTDKPGDDKDVTGGQKKEVRR